MKLINLGCMTIMMVVFMYYLVTFCWIDPTAFVENSEKHVFLATFSFMGSLFFFMSYVHDEMMKERNYWREKYDNSRY